MNERTLAIDCFGGRVALRASGPGAGADLMAAAAKLLAIHARLTRFSPGSELSRLNADPRAVLPASSLLRELAAAVRFAGALSGGLVDATSLDALEAAGYRDSLRGRARVAFAAPDHAPRPAIPDPAASWQTVHVDEETRTISRLPGVRIDPGGLAKGLAADLVAAMFAERSSYVVDCGGDLRLGGRARATRPVLVRDPLGGEPIPELEVAEGAVATSGVTRRTWRGAAGGVGHHLIDPGRAEPAWTGILQVTALAPTALAAEVRAKTALLAGPAGAAGNLPHGGVVVLGDGSVEVFDPVATAVAA